MGINFTALLQITCPEQCCGGKPFLSCHCEKAAIGEGSLLEAPLPQMGSREAIGPGKLCVGLRGLAARALCLDLADLKFAGSQLPEHWLPRPRSALHGP